MPDTHTWKNKVRKNLTLANGITAFRIVLFALCIGELSSGHSNFAIILFALAWGLDAVDGFIARAMNQETVFGSQMDKVIDRIILIGGGMFLIRYGYLPAFAIFLFVKDIGLSVALTVKPKGALFLSAGILGKLVSVLQGLSVIWLFFGVPGQVGLVAFVGLLGGFVAVRYLREL